MIGIEVALVAEAAALIGMVAHWAKGYYINKRPACARTYFLKNQLGRSVAAAVSVTGAVVGLLAAGSTPTDIAQASIADIAPYFLIGYTLDSAVNKA